MDRFKKTWKAMILLGISIALTLPSVLSSAEVPQDMAYVPAGEFTMGNDTTDDRKRMGGIIAVDETPKRKVYLDAFFIDKYEVTNRQYKDYLDALKKTGITAFSHYSDEGIPIPDRWSIETYPEGMDDRPVVDVDWYMSTKYCAWKNKRLPSEEEWEKAARGTDERTYPWGNDSKPGYANTREYWQGKFKDAKAGEIPWIELPVGNFEKDLSPYGIHDMAGNVTEWTTSLYRPYPGNNLKRTVFNREYYVLRGGAYDLLLFEFGRTTARNFRGPTDSLFAHAEWHTNMNVGFRCAMDAE